MKETNVKKLFIAILLMCGIKEEQIAQYLQKRDLRRKKNEKSI